MRDIICPNCLTRYNSCGDDVHGDVMNLEPSAPPSDGDMLACHWCGAFLIVDGGKLHALDAAQTARLWALRPAAAAAMTEAVTLRSAYGVRNAHLN